LLICALCGSGAGYFAPPSNTSALFDNPPESLPVEEVGSKKGVDLRRPRESFGRFVETWKVGLFQALLGW
jgi:hypothetical protein